MGPRGGIADLSWLKTLERESDQKENVWVSELSRPKPTPEVRCPEFAYTQQIEKKKAKKRAYVHETKVTNKYGIETLLPIYPAGYIMDKSQIKTYFESLKGF